MFDFNKENLKEFGKKMFYVSYEKDENHVGHFKLGWGWMAVILVLILLIF